MGRKEVLQRWHNRQIWGDLEVKYYQDAVLWPDSGSPQVIPKGLIFFGNHMYIQGCFQSCGAVCQSSWMIKQPSSFWYIYFLMSAWHKKSPKTYHRNIPFWPKTYLIWKKGGLRQKSLNWLRLFLPSAHVWSGRDSGSGQCLAVNTQKRPCEYDWLLVTYCFLSRVVEVNLKTRRSVTVCIEILCNASLGRGHISIFIEISSLNFT